MSRFRYATGQIEEHGLVRVRLLVSAFCLHLQPQSASSNALSAFNAFVIFAPREALRQRFRRARRAAAPAAGVWLKHVAAFVTLAHFARRVV